LVGGYGSDSRGGCCTHSGLPANAPGSRLPQRAAAAERIELSPTSPVRRTAIYVYARQAAPWLRDRRGAGAADWRTARVDAHAGGTEPSTSQVESRAILSVPASALGVRASGSPQNALARGGSGRRGCRVVVLIREAHEKCPRYKLQSPRASRRAISHFNPPWSRHPAAMPLSISIT